MLSFEFYFNESYILLDIKRRILLLHQHNKRLLRIITCLCGGSFTRIHKNWSRQKSIIKPHKNTEMYQPNSQHFFSLNISHKYLTTKNDLPVARLIVHPNTLFLILLEQIYAIFCDHNETRDESIDQEYT